MAELDKVKKGLHQHCEGSLFDRCGECPYYEMDFGTWEESKFKCRDELLSDARELLKGQEHEVCENCPYKLEDIGDFSDGYHTFNDLYYQRCVLFATIVNMNKSKAWKTRYHEDGEPCFGGGWFLVTVETPEGAYGYHYEEERNCYNCGFYSHECVLMEVKSAW